MMTWPLGLLSKRRLVAAADAARDARDWTSAAKLYRVALNRDGGHAAIWVQYGHMLKEAGDLSGADAAYRRAVGMAANADIHLQIGHLRKLQGDHAAAVSSYRRALEMDPLLEDASIELERLAGRTTGSASAPAHAVPPSREEARISDVERRIDAIGGQMSLFLEHVATTKALAFEIAATSVRLDALSDELRSRLETGGRLAELSRRIEELARRLDSVVPRLAPSRHGAHAEGADDGGARS